MEFEWESGFSIGVRADNGEVVISANKAGLISLANHLMALAEAGGHFHLDEHNSLEPHSCELIVERME